MKTEWDYSDLALSYLKRPDYADEAIDNILRITGIKSGNSVCDIGAGVAHLTLMLAARGMRVTAIEPNDAMRKGGMKRTCGVQEVTWREATGERTGQPDATFDMVVFGSSFNVTDRLAALKETHRILKPLGWFACIWNHRDLNDPIQSGIEDVIKNVIPDYQYGSRRADQTSVIIESGLFDAVQPVEGYVRHAVSLDDCINAWRSHATLHRQAGEKFNYVADAIALFLKKTGKSIIEIPYKTQGWIARKSAGN